MPQGTQYQSYEDSGKDGQRNTSVLALKKALDEAGVSQGFNVGEGGQSTIPPGQMKALLGAMISRDPKAAADLLQSMGISPEEFVAMILERDESEGLTFDVDETKLSTAMETIKADDSPAKKLGQELAQADTGVAAPPPGPGAISDDDPRVQQERRSLEVQGIPEEIIGPQLEEFKKTLPPLPPKIVEPADSVATRRRAKELELETMGIKPGTPMFEKLMQEYDAGEAAPTPAPDTPVPPPPDTAEPEPATPADVTAGSTGEPVPEPVASPPGPGARETGVTSTTGSALAMPPPSPPGAAPTDATKRLQVLSDILSGVSDTGNPEFTPVSAPSAPGGASGIDQTQLLRMIAEARQGGGQPLRLGQALNLGR